MSVTHTRRGRPTEPQAFIRGGLDRVGDEAVVRLARAGIVRTGLMAASWERRVAADNSGVGIWGQFYARFVDARGRWAGFIRRTLEGL